MIQYYACTGVYLNKQERRHFVFTWSELTQNILEGKWIATTENVLFSIKLRHQPWDHKFSHILFGSVTNDKVSILCLLCSYVGHTNRLETFL